MRRHGRGIFLPCVEPNGSRRPFLRFSRRSEHAHRYCGHLPLRCDGGARAADAAADPSKDSQNSTGRTVIPEKQGPLQPQGHTGPINTTSGGAPAESPQGQTPPGMQAAPDGSSKTIVDGTK